MNPITSSTPLEYVLQKVKVMKPEQTSASGDNKFEKYFVSVKKEKKVSWKS